MNHTLVLLFFMFLYNLSAQEKERLNITLLHHDTENLIEGPFQIVTHLKNSSTDTINFQNGHLKLMLKPEKNYSLTILTPTNCYTGIQFGNIIIKNIRITEENNIDSLLIKSTLPPCYEWVYDPDTQTSSHLPVGTTDYIRDGKYAQVVNNHLLIATIKDGDIHFDFDNLLLKEPLEEPFKVTCIEAHLSSGLEDYDTRPYPKGGFPNFYMYIINNTRYPKNAKRRRLEGNVFLEFLVQKDGNIAQESIEIMQGISLEIDKEAERLILACPLNWTPATFQGQNIDFKVAVLIKFEL